MREVVHRRANHSVWALALLTVTVCVLAFAAPALAASSPEPAPASSATAEAAASAPPMAAASASPSPSPSPVSATLTCSLSSSSVIYGDQVTVSGVLEPAAEAQEIVVTLGGAEVGRARTDASGAYQLAFTPRRGGDNDPRKLAIALTGVGISFAD